MGAALAQQMRDIAERANPLYQEIIEGCRCGAEQGFSMYRFSMYRGLPQLLGRDMDMEFERAIKLLRKDGFVVETWETDDYVNCKIYW